jgi:hypothetical protein
LSAREVAEVASDLVTNYEYSEEDWEASAGHRPLQGLDVNQVFLLHRHWIWANYQRQQFQAGLKEAPPPDDGAFLAHETWSAMFLWYALLWSVIEGFGDRSIDIRGQMRADIDRLADTLRQCRNVVFHVSSKNQHDTRLFGLMQDPESAYVISRISTGFGRLFIEDHAARRAAGEFG